MKKLVALTILLFGMTVGVHAVKEQQAEIISLKADILKLKLGALTTSDVK